MPTDSHEFYASPGRHTDVSGFGFAIEGADDAVEIVQGLLVYDLFASSFYGVELSGRQTAAVHLRDAAALLGVALEVDSRPLSQARRPECRVGGRCNTYTLLTVALLRAAGIPARARCGFASYFVPGYYEDHWVAEYWNAEAQRWEMIDAQLDDTWRRAVAMDGETPVAVGPEQFLSGDLHAAETRAAVHHRLRRAL